MFKMFNNRKGFSLVELIVVIVILGVLVGIAAPNLIKYVDDARRGKDIANAENIRKAGMAIYTQTQDATKVTDTAIAEYMDGGKYPVPEYSKKTANVFVCEVDATTKQVIVKVGSDQVAPEQTGVYATGAAAPSPT